jgi:hypothetical protein
VLSVQSLLYELIDRRRLLEEKRLPDIPLAPSQDF